MGLAVWCLSGAVGAGVAWLWWELCGGKWRWRYRLPPGPPPLPLLGNLLAMDPAKPWEAIRAAAKRYGPVITMWIGPKPSIIVTDLDLIKSTFRGESGKKFADRPFNAIFHDLNEQGRHGMVYSNGRRWERHRTFAIQHMKQFGMGSKDEGMVQKTFQCIDEMVKHLKSEVEAGGGAAEVDILSEIALVATNVILSFVVGRGYARGDPEFHHSQALLHRCAQIWTGPEAMIFNCWPGLVAVPGLNRLLGWARIQEANAEFMRYFGEMVARARSEWDGKATSCFAFLLFAEQRRRKEKGDEPEIFSDMDILSTLKDMVGGGADTSRHTIGFALIYLLRNPRVQERCEREIADAMGLGRDGRRITLEDRERLPYVQATIYESQRLANLMVVNAFHTVSEAGVKISGYDVPPSVPVHPEISAAMMDPRNFAEPEEFRPERFLNVPMPEAFLPFSIGGRRCPGEALARSELFLIFANILQNFSIRPKDPQNLPSAEPIMGLTVSPRPYTLILASHN